MPDFQTKPSGSGFKAIREYEPELSDEALENMVPPPKRQIREDTPLVDLTTKQRNADYSLANYMGQYPSE